MSSALNHTSRRVIGAGASRQAQRPSSLRHSNLVKWCRRLVPTTQHDAWRGCKPTLGGLNPGAVVTDLQPGAVLWNNQDRCTQFVLCRGRWVVQAPLAKPLVAGSPVVAGGLGTGWQLASRVSGL
jgi:hypothetical protein